MKTKPSDILIVGVLTWIGGAIFHNQDAINAGIAISAATGAACAIKFVWERF